MGCCCACNVLCFRRVSAWVNLPASASEAPHTYAPLQSPIAMTSTRIPQRSPAYRGGWPICSGCATEFSCLTSSTFPAIPVEHLVVTNVPLLQPLGRKHIHSKLPPARQTAIAQAEPCSRASGGKLNAAPGSRFTHSKFTFSQQRIQEPKLVEVDKNTRAENRTRMSPLATACNNHYTTRVLDSSLGHVPDAIHKILPLFTRFVAHAQTTQTQL